MTSGPILVVVGLQREARIVAGPGIVCVCGGGAGDLAQRIEAAIEAHRPEEIMSFGLAGGLVRDIEPGDFFVGSVVVAGGERYDCDADWRERMVLALSAIDPAAEPGDPHVGLFVRSKVGYGSFPRLNPRNELRVAGAESMITSARAKQALQAETGAFAVDMESLAAARAASAHGLPLAVVRAVSDSSARDLPKAVLNGMTPDGGMNLWGVLGALAADPRQLPDLIRTGRDAGRGFKALYHARRLLGPRLGRADLG